LLLLFAIVFALVLLLIIYNNNNNTGATIHFGDIEVSTAVMLASKQLGLAPHKVTTGTSIYSAVDLEGIAGCLFVCLFVVCCLFVVYSCCSWLFVVVVCLLFLLKTTHAQDIAVMMGVFIWSISLAACPVWEVRI
jgi:hypothetical protein